MCVGLNGDFSEKQIQIAHIDHNRENHSLVNLVALCLFHHDDYDSRKSQSKGITKHEIKHYRSELDKVVQKIDEQLQIPNVESSSNENSIATPSAKLIGQILEAYDKEFFALQNCNRPNGIALTRLARIAIEEEGDFDAAIEAFIALLRLASFVRQTGRIVNTGKEIVKIDKEALRYELTVQTPISNEVRSANVVNAAVKVLEIMSQIDSILFRRAIDRACRFSLIGNADIKVLLNYDELPDESFGAVNSILIKACHKITFSDVKWADKEIAQKLAGTLLGLGYVLNERGIDLPEPPKIMYMTFTGQRWISEERHKDLLPLVSLAHAIATLPDNSYKYALENFKYFHTGMFPTEKASPIGRSISYALEALKINAATPNSGAYIIYGLEKQEDVEVFNKHLQEVTTRGTQVSLKLVEFIIAERELAMKSIKH